VSTVVSGHSITTATSELAIGGCVATELARIYGTPLYVYDEARLRRQCLQYRQAFQAQWHRSEVAYAVKAFGAVAMLRLAYDERLGLDVVSVGELAAAERAGMPPDRVTFHGVAKTVAEMRCAVQAGVAHVVIDAPEEVGELADICRRLGRRQPALMRIDPDTAVPSDPRYIANGADRKFGMALADGSAVDATRAALASEHLRIDGVHFHLGSQLMTAKPYVEAMRRTESFIRQVDGWLPNRVVVGGGMGVAYDGTRAPTPSYWAAEICAAFKAVLAPACAPDVTLGIEPGRSVVADSGYTLYRVGAVKRRPGGPRAMTLVVDGGLSDNPRPLMYSATHPVVLASAPRAHAETIAHIYGRHCETDLLFRDVALPRVRRGAVLAVEITGAYTHCMASNYNRFARPAVVFALDGQSRLVVRREEPDDLLRTDVLQ
jgi:diaminopimelate decarboxylase